MAYRRARKQVTWTAAAAEERARAKRPHPHMVEVPITQEHEAWIDALLPGCLWQVGVGMGPLTTCSPEWYLQHEIPYLTLPNWGAPPAVPAGAPAVYMGLTRVEEITSRGTLMTFLRHVFLIDGRRWMVFDLNLLRPVTLPLKQSQDDAGMREEAP